MPVNRAYNVDDLFEACRWYFHKPDGASFEYAMIDGVNDQDWQADLIARKVRGMPAHVNLIRSTMCGKGRGSPAGACPLFRGGWRAMGLPPQSGGAWAGILMLPAASCANGQQKQEKGDRREKRRYGV